MDPAIKEPDTPRTLAVQAMRRFQAGDADAGLVLYNRVLRSRPDSAIPIGLHCRMLKTLGQGDAADIIRRRALVCGWDIAALPAPLSTQRHEYERLLADGIGNAKMVNGYLGVLDQIGDVDAIRPWTAVQPLLQQRVLPADLLAMGLPDQAADALLDRVRDQPPEAVNRSGRNLRQVMQTQAIGHPALTTLHKAMHGLAQEYARMLREAAHPYARLGAEAFAPFSWAVISDGTGHNVAHDHGAAFVVAVAYLKIPPLAGRRAEDCRLHIGAPPLAANPGAWTAADISPEPGMVVLMPGYFYHWTHPYPGGGTRISLAVNFWPQHAGDPELDGGIDY